MSTGGGGGRGHSHPKNKKGGMKRAYTAPLLDVWGHRCPSALRIGLTSCPHSGPETFRDSVTRLLMFTPPPLFPLGGWAHKLIL